jgi:S1-C subfamily serine protease
MSLKSNRIRCLGIPLCLLWAFAASADNSVSDSTVKMVERSKVIVTQSVFRVSGKKYNGTGFLHKSGVVITAAHLIAGGDTSSIKILSPRNETFTITNMVLDTLLDLAILWPAKPINAPAFPLAYTNTIQIGSQIFVWGFPRGYSGQNPLLVVGYVAGHEMTPVASNLVTMRMEINAAISAGQSGAPLVQADNGNVIGMVVGATVDAAPPRILEALQILDQIGNRTVAVTNTATGESKTVSEGQLLREVVTYLKSLEQQNIGDVVPGATLARFLQRNGIEP